MNKILNKKINNDLTNIIKSYLLISTKNVNNNKNKCFYQLLDKTEDILYDLNNNKCSDSLAKKYIFDLKNSKITHITIKYLGNTNFQYWTIRKIN